LQRLAVDQVARAEIYQVTGQPLGYNPFQKMRQLSINYEKTQELRDDISMLKQINAKDIPKLNQYNHMPHATP
jgi:hypothetical protein